MWQIAGTHHFTETAAARTSICDVHEYQCGLQPDSQLLGCGNRDTADGIASSERIGCGVGRCSAIAAHYRCAWSSHAGAEAQAGLIIGRKEGGGVGIVAK